MSKVSNRFKMFDIKSVQFRAVVARVNLAPTNPLQYVAPNENLQCGKYGCPREANTSLVTVTIIEEKEGLSC